MHHDAKMIWTPPSKRSLYLGLVFFILAIIIQIAAGHYSARSSANANFAGDLFLDNLPTVNLEIFIVGGGILVWGAAAVLGLLYKRHLLFSLKAVSLFIIVRAFFINLTHLGAYPTSHFVPLAGAIGSIYNSFTFRGNFFFSGHTGFPFLLALIFWDKKNIRRVFLFLSLLFGAVVLLAHVHYSIDVFAAPFITYGIFIIAQRVFYDDYRILLEAGAQPVS
jgi:hypothetical protein